MDKKWAVLVLAVGLSGCTAYKIDSVVSKYIDVAGYVKLGDSKEEVLMMLEPTQEGLPKSARKNPERYIKNGVEVEIYYMRSARQPDDLTTDDEFVPYVFNDGKLVGIGWQLLGGPKTQGQAAPRIYIQKNTN